MDLNPRPFQREVEICQEISHEQYGSMGPLESWGPKNHGAAGQLPSVPMP